MNKRILSILLCLMLVASLLVLAVPVNAAPTDPQITVTADKTEAKPGDEITFTVTLGPITELANIYFVVDIPAGLTFVAKSGTIVDQGIQDHFDTLEWTEKSKVFNGTVATPDYEKDTDTELLTFKCTVDDDASGDLDVTVKDLEMGSMYFEEWTDLFTVVPVTVSVSAGSPSTEAPATEAPTEAPATEAPATEAPTEAPATEAPATEAPTEAPAPELTYVPEVPATATEPGVKAHYEDMDGNKYADATGLVPVTDEDLYIAPVGEPTEAPTEAPATEAPATEAPTEAPATEAPATEAPATEAPATEAPATEAPATEAPATEAPATEAPATEAPATEAPATEAPATEAPATEAPATEAPATEAPATEAPATEAPATEAPTDAPGMLLEFVEEVPATDTTAGIKAHYVDPSTGKMYADATGREEVTEADLYIAPLKPVATSATEGGKATPDQPTTKATTTATTKAATTSPKTGDSTHMYLWMLIMIASLAGACAVLYTAKRKGIFTK